MRSHECLYFLFLIWNTVNPTFFSFVYFTRHLWHPHQMCRTSNFWFNILRDQHKSASHLSKQANDVYSYSSECSINMPRCNCERMRDKDIKFIHIISIMTVVYSNDINLKILMSHWRHLTKTFKLPQASYIVSLDDIRFHERSSTSNLSQPASIRLCTLCFKVIQCSMECPGAPPW